MYLIIIDNSFFGWKSTTRPYVNCSSLKKKWYVIFTFSGSKVKNETYKFADNEENWPWRRNKK